MITIKYRTTLISENMESKNTKGEKIFFYLTAIHHTSMFQVGTYNFQVKSRIVLTVTLQCMKTLLEGLSLCCEFKLFQIQGFLTMEKDSRRNILICKINDTYLFLMIQGLYHMHSFLSFLSQFESTSILSIDE